MIGIFSSDFNDFEGILKKGCLIKKYSIGEMRIAEAMLCNKKILLVATGYNKINIGISLGYILKNYCIKKIINIGSCASTSTKNKIGDIAISTNLIQFDIDATALGYKEGVVPGLNVDYYSSDNALATLAFEKSESLFFCVSFGVFGTSEKFIASYEESANIKRKFKVDFIDMESANIAQAGYIYQIPTISIKGISNYADEAAGEDYYKNVSLVTNKVCDIVIAMLG